MRRWLWRPLPADTILDDVMAPMRVVLAGYRVIFVPFSGGKPVLSVHLLDPGIEQAVQRGLVDDRPGNDGKRFDRNDRGDRRDRPAQPTISDLLREGQEILVQIAKEPIAKKGARITSHIALPGRFLVGDARRLSEVKDMRQGGYDAAAFVLSIQDMDPLEPVFESLDWALRPASRVVIVMTHPAFRQRRKDLIPPVEDLTDREHAR